MAWKNMQDVKSSLILLQTRRGFNEVMEPRGWGEKEGKEQGSEYQQYSVQRLVLNEVSFLLKVDLHLFSDVSK